MGLFDIFKNKKDNLTEEIDEYNTGQDEKNQAIQKMMKKNMHWKHTVS